jgi:adenylate cyclase
VVDRATIPAPTHAAAPGFDESFQEALRERDARIEHRVNLVRGAVIAPLMLADLVYARLAGILSVPLLRDWGAVLLAFVLYFLAVDRLTRGAIYRPWLKYLTVSVDYLLTLVLYIECQRVGFFVGASPTDGVAVFLGFLVLLSVLGAFRHGRGIILYGTAISVAAAGYLTTAHADSIALKVYAPVLLASCGLLTYSLSSGLTDLFLQTWRRQWLVRFLPHAVAQGIETGEIQLALGGVKQEATILLADLRGFTNLTEDRDPYDVVALLNEYFTAMAGVIRKHGGMIDKFIGDAILAVFGVPLAHTDDALSATAAALAMQEALGGLNRGWAARGVPHIAMGIALHTGTVVAGHVGSPERLEYTVVGDVVNVTARIEELNKVYRTGILMSESTYLRVRDRVSARFVADTMLRGRHDAVRLYTPQASVVDVCVPSID